MFMLSILQSLTCVWLYFGGQNSVRKKEVLKYIHYDIETQIPAFFHITTVSVHGSKAINWKRRLPRNILSDAIGELSIYKSTKDYPTHRRKVCFWDEEQKHKFTFLTNAIDLSPLQIAEHYKKQVAD